MPDNEQNIINRESFGGSDIRRVRTHYQGQAQNFCKMKNEIIVPLAGKEVNRALVAKKAKLKIIEYGFTSEDKSTVRIYTEDEGLIDARRCPSEITGKRVLYCTREGVFLSLSRFGLREVQQNESARYLAGGHRGGSRYPKLSYFGNKACHILMWETWVGERTPGMEIDHINGDKMDYRLCNLEEVTQEENRKRAGLLRVLRSIGRDPRKMSREELLGIFRKYEFVDGSKQTEYEMTHHCEV